MLLLACLLQTTLWPVDSPTSFLAAEAAALPGDLIELQPGTYEFPPPTSFSVSKGITVTVAGEGRATIRSASVPSSVQAPSALEAAKLERLDFEPLYLFPVNTGGGLRVGDGLGVVYLEDCTARGGIDNLYGLRTLDANVVVRGGSYSGSGIATQGGGSEGGDGLVATGTNLMAEGAEFIAAAGYSATYFGAPSNPTTSRSGGHGALLQDTRANFADCRLVGGDGGGGYLYIDPSFGTTYCSPSSNGGNALQFDTGAPSIVSLFDASLEPGEGGISYPQCQTTPSLDGLFYGGDGLDQASIAYFSLPLELDVPSTIASNSTVQLSLSGSTVTAPRFIALSPGTTTGLVTNLGMTSMIGPAITLLPVPTLPGPSPISVPVGALPPSLPFLELNLQGVELLSPLHLTAPARVTIR